jgi:hypothetical protein
LPFDLHARISRDPALESAVLGVFIDELTAQLRTVTGTEEPLGQAGTLSVSQKFGSSINLHVHFHVLALDGVYTRDDETGPLTQSESSSRRALRFVRAPTPTVEQLEQLLQRVAARVRELVGRADPVPDLPEVQAPLLRVYGAEPAEQGESTTPKLVASSDGFNLHAATAFEGHERMAIERWCRYALRGPLVTSRLSLGPRDTAVYTLTKPKADGTTQLVFPVVSFLRRLVAVLPLPRHHTITYHGVFAAAHRWRAAVVESVPKTESPGRCPRKMRRLEWADLLRRVFAWEVLACACGGTRRVLATIPKGPIAEKLLKHLKLPTAPPALGRARPAAQTELWDTGPPVDDDRQVHPAGEFDFDQRLAECEFPD